MSDGRKDFDNNEFFFGDDVIYPDNKKDMSNQKDVSECVDKVGREQHTQIYRPKKTFVANLFEWLEVVVASIVAVVIIFTFVFRIVAIDGNSMKNTLFDGERVIITDLFYEPQRGDIVVISRNTDNSSGSDTFVEPIIKRVIALQGDIVDIRNGVVFVNDQKIDEPYLWETPLNKGDVEFPVRVKENCIFVLGDNRNDSLDSRSKRIGENGMINKKYILGHAVMRIFPLERVGVIE